MEPFDGLRKDLEHTLVGFQGVVEVDDTAVAGESFDDRKHALGGVLPVVIMREDIP